MAITLTTNKSIQKPAHGDNVNTWDVPVNFDWDAIDTALGGTTALNITGLSGNVNLTVTQYRAPIFIITGTLTANVTYVLPTGVGGLWSIYNGASGNFTITIASAGGGTSISVSATQWTFINCDGTNVNRADTQASDQPQSQNYGVDTGIANTYVVTLSPPLAVNFAGMPIRVRITHTNTGASTLNAGPGALAIKNDDGTDLQPSQLVAGGIYTFIYDGTVYRLDQTTVAAQVTWLNGLTGGVSTTAAQLFGQYVDAITFGVDATVTDNSTAINAAITAAQANGYGVVFLPKGVLKIANEITGTNNVILVGQGTGSTIIRQTGATKNGYVLSNVTLTSCAAGLRDLTIEAGAGFQTSGFTGSGSTGVGVKVNLANDTFTCENVNINNFDHPLQVLGCWTGRYDGMRILYHTNEGVKIDIGSAGPVSGGNIFNGVKVSNNGFTGTNTSSVSFNIVQTGGDIFTNCDGTAANQSWVIRPGLAGLAAYCWFISCLGDTPVTDGWTFDGSAGTVISHRGSDMWGAYSTNGSGLVTKGGGVDGLFFANFALRENGKHGWDNQGGSNVNLVNPEIASNSKLTINTYNGVNVAADVSGWGILGGRIGNFASGLTGQNNGISIASGNSANFRIIGVDLRNNVNVPLANGSNSSGALIINNLPLGSSGLNTTQGFRYSGNTNGQLPAGATYFFGPNGSLPSATSSVLDNLYLTGRPSLVNTVIVTTDNAPGAGQSYTYTFIKNGVATALTATSSGAGSFLAVLGNVAITLGATDSFSVQATLSGAATATRHRWVIMGDY